MSALEQLGRYIADSEPPSNELRELVELHLIDTVGALIAGTRTLTAIQRMACDVSACRRR